MSVWNVIGWWLFIVGAVGAIFSLIQIIRCSSEAKKSQEECKKSEPKVEPVVEPKAEPKVEPVVEPEAEPKVEPVVEPEAEPKVEPVVEPEAEPEVELVVEPEAEPEAEPEVESKVEPKEDPKSREDRLKEMNIRRLELDIEAYDILLEGPNQEKAAKFKAWQNAVREATVLANLNASAGYEAGESEAVEEMLSVGDEATVADEAAKASAKVAAEAASEDAELKSAAIESLQKALKKAAELEKAYRAYCTAEVQPLEEARARKVARLKSLKGE
jgi:hypothetical protein